MNHTSSARSGAWTCMGPKPGRIDSATCSGVGCQRARTSTAIDIVSEERHRVAAADEQRRGQRQGQVVTPT